jgi:hypothetical protein
MLALLAVLFILANVLVALGVLPSITLFALAILNAIGWLLAILVGGAAAGWWPFQRPTSAS